jgi:F0F1-type ATP synthase membrane subunit b/b'
LGSSLIALALATATNSGGLAGSPPVDIWGLIQFGFVGFVLVCMTIRKWIVPEWTLKAAEERHVEAVRSKDAEITALKSQVERLQDVTHNQTLPALLRSAEIVAKYNEEAAHKRWATYPDRDVQS